MPPPRSAKSSPTTPSKGKLFCSNFGPPGAASAPTKRTSWTRSVMILPVKDCSFLAIDVGESKKTVKKYLEQHPRTCKIVYMEDTNLAAMYAATVYPIYVVIDRDGYIAGTQRGAGGEEALKRLLARGGLEMPEDSE